MGDLHGFYYVKSGDTAQALECISKAVSIGKGDGGKWLPSQEAISTLMSQFEGLMELRVCWRF